jgi:hypothetical protein
MKLLINWRDWKSEHLLARPEQACGIIAEAAQKVVRD